MFFSIDILFWTFLWLFLLQSLIVIRDSLADNVVEELPASLCNLIQLKSLSLDNNQVNQVNRLKCVFFCFWVY